MELAKLAMKVHQLQTPEAEQVLLGYQNDLVQMHHWMWPYDTAQTCVLTNDAVL